MGAGGCSGASPFLPVLCPRGSLLAATGRDNFSGRWVLTEGASAPAGVRLRASISRTPPFPGRQEYRRSYRELLFTVPGLQEHISGVIVHPEVLAWRSANGEPLGAILTGRGIAVGVKLDLGLTDLEGGEPGEQRTKGLEGLEARAREGHQAGASFAKWRAVLRIAAGEAGGGGTLPSDAAVQRNAADLAEYALACQRAELVPIVEPEILLEGKHSIERTAEVTERVLSQLFSELKARGVDLSATLLKPSMVMPGTALQAETSPEEVARWTVDTFKKCVPAEVAGVVFLSGGQSEACATKNLDAIVREAAGSGAPWPLTFSYGRALQASVLRAWMGKEERAGEAQRVALALAAANGAASEGKFQGKSHPSD